MDKNWNTIWFNDNSFGFNKIIETYNGQIILAGADCCDNGFVVSLLTPFGDKIWENYFSKVFEVTGGSAYSLVELPNGEIIASGVSGFAPTIGGGGNFYVLKLDKNGEILICETIPGFFAESKISSIIYSSDGGILFVSSVLIPDRKSQVYVVKLDQDLNIIWAKDFGGNENELGLDVVELNQGGYAISGYSNSESIKGDAYLIIIDNNGNLISEKMYAIGENSGFTYYEFGNAIIQTFDGGLAITGRVASEKDSDAGKLLFIKTDAYGNVN